MAAATPTIPISPTPLIPNGLTVLSGSSTKMILILDISVHWHMVLGNVGVHDATEVVVDQCLFMEGHANPPDHAPDDLTGRGFRIDDATGRNRVNNARYADDAELLVHLHFGEDCRVRVARMFVVFFKFNKLFVLDAIHATMPHGVRKRYRPAFV